MDREQILIVLTACFWALIRAVYKENIRKTKKVSIKPKERKF